MCACEVSLSPIDRRQVTPRRNAWHPMSREFDASDWPDEANIQVGLAHEGSNPGEGDDPAGDV